MSAWNIILAYHFSLYRAYEVWPFKVVKSPLIVREQLGSLVIIIFFLPKKNLHRDTYRKTLQTIIFNISKDILDSPNVLDLWPFTELFNILRKTLVSRSSWKQLTLHAWKFIYKKTLIRWRHCVFILCDRWSLRELLPLKLDKFYVKI
jgi:hypothetical protein